MATKTKSHLAVEGAPSAPTTPEASSSDGGAHLLKSLGFDFNHATPFMYFICSNNLACVTVYDRCFILLWMIAIHISFIIKLLQPWESVCSWFLYYIVACCSLHMLICGVLIYVCMLNLNICGFIIKFMHEYIIKLLQILHSPCDLCTLNLIILWFYIHYEINSG